MGARKVLIGGVTESEEGMDLLRKIFLTETAEPLTQGQGARRSLALQKREVGSVLSESGEDRQLSRNGICF